LEEKERKQAEKRARQEAFRQKADEKEKVPAVDSCNVLYTPVRENMCSVNYIKMYFRRMLTSLVLKTNFFGD